MNTPAAETSNFVTERDQAFLNLATRWRLEALAEKSIGKDSEAHGLTEYARASENCVRTLRLCADMLELMVKTGSCEPLPKVIDSLS